MRCKKCNAVIKDNAEVCPECGYKNTEELSGLNLGSLKSLKKDSKVDALPDGYPRHYYHEDGKRGFAAILIFYKKSFDFTGVSDWVEYWTQSLFLIIISIISLIVRRMILLDPTNATTFILVLLIVLAVILLISILPNISATVRRLHDAGYSGFWYFAALIPIFGSLILLFLTIGPFKRSEFNRGSEKKPTIKVRLEE